MEPTVQRNHHPSQGSTKAAYLQFAKELTLITHISKFRGKRAGVDISLWINRAIRNPTIIQQLYDNPDSQAFLGSILLKLDLLKHYDITPYCVFDGNTIPKKLKELRRRRAQRNNSERIGRNILNELNQQQAILQNLVRQNQTQIPEEDLNSIEPIDPEQAVEQQEVISDIEYPEEDLKNNFNQNAIEELNPDQLIEHIKKISEKQATQKEILSKQEINFEFQASLKDQTALQNIDKIPQNVENVEQIVYKEILEKQPKELQEKKRKQKEEEERIKQEETKKKKREEQIKKIQLQLLELQKRGKKYLSRGIAMDQNIITITMRVLEQKGIHFMVAPFEADFQLVKLKQSDIIDFIISQDGDLIIQQVPTVYKLQPNGNCQFIDLSENLKLKRQQKKSVTLALMNFTKLTKFQKAEVASLAGTDYFQSAGSGLKKTVEYYCNSGKDIEQTLNRMKKNKGNAKKIKADHLQQTFQVKMILMLHIVADPDTAEQKFLHPEEESKFRLSKFGEQFQFRDLVGPEYGYDEEMMSGIKSTRFPFRLRDLSPLSIQQESILNLAEIKQQKEKCELQGIKFKMDIPRNSQPTLEYFLN